MRLNKIYEDTRTIIIFIERTIFSTKDIILEMKNCDFIKSIATSSIKLLNFLSEVAYSLNSPVFGGTGS